MKKIAIILDSFVALSKKEIEKYGFFFIPQSIIIDGKSYKEGIDISLNEKTIEILKKAKNIKTSMPSIGEVELLLEKLSDKFENILVIPMNKGLSSTFSIISAAAANYKNVFVLENKLAGTGILTAALKAQEMANKNESMVVIMKKLKNFSDSSYCYVIPKNVESLIKSGRLTGIKKIILQKAKLIPKLFLNDNGFVVKSVKKNFKKTLSSTIDSIINNVKNYQEYDWELISGGDIKSYESVERYLKEKNINYKKSFTSTMVSAYAGIEAIGINIWKK